MNRGVPPTEPNARTGELTPPGVTLPARSNSCSLRGVAEIVPSELSGRFVIMTSGEYLSVQNGEDSRCLERRGGMSYLRSTVPRMSRYRLQPSPAQEAVLRKHCADARFVWNLCVEQEAQWRPGRGRMPGFA